MSTSSKVLKKKALKYHTQQNLEFTVQKLYLFNLGDFILIIHIELPYLTSIFLPCHKFLARIETYIKWLEFGIQRNKWVFFKYFKNIYILNLVKLYRLFQSHISYWGMVVCVKNYRKGHLLHGSLPSMKRRKLHRMTLFSWIISIYMVLFAGLLAF